MVWYLRKERSSSGTYGELGGLQIGIAIISSFKHHDDVTPITASYNDSEYLSKYAKSIYDQWGICEADCNNGIMIFMAIDDRVLYTSTGKGVKTIITDSFIDHYNMQHIRPFGGYGDYDRAFIEMLDIIYEMLLCQDDVENSEVNSEWNRRTDRYSTAGDTVFSLFGFWDVTTKDCLIFSSVAELLGLFYIKYKREEEYRECQNRLAAIYAQSQRRLNQQSRPICLEDLPNNSSSSSESSKAVKVVIIITFVKRGISLRT